MVSRLQVPAMPEVLLEILRTSRSPEGSYQDIINHTAKDPGLTLKLLKVVNSTYFGVRNKVLSLPHAVVLLGMNMVMSITSGLLMLDTFRSLVSHEQDYVRKVWEHSITTAALSKVIGGSLPQETRDTVFMSAVIHEFGRLVLARQFPQELSPLREHSPYPDAQQEIKSLGMDHAQAGAILLEAWKFPDEVISLVRHHHDRVPPEGAGYEFTLFQASEEISILVREHRTPWRLQESDLSPEFLFSLKSLGWSWSTLEAHKEPIDEALGFASTAMGVLG